MNKFKLLLQGDILTNDMEKFTHGFEKDFLDEVMAEQNEEDDAKITSAKLKISTDGGNTWQIHKNPKSPA